MNEVCQQYLCHSMRTYLYKEYKRFPWQLYLQLFYNDSLTYNPSTKKGGLKANYQVNQSIARDTHFKHLQHLASEIVYKKNFEEDIVIDKLSMSDYLTAFAFMVVRESEGPNILDDIGFGRKDATKEEGS